MDGRVGDLLVVLLNLEIGENSVASVGIGHDPPPSVDQPLLEKLFEDVPN